MYPRTQTLVESERVASAALLRPLPRRWHMYVWPFVSMLYPVFIYVYYNHYETYLGSEEWTFVALGSIITLHAMTFLVCQWSVDVKALFTCVKVSIDEGWISCGSNQRLIKILLLGK